MHFKLALFACTFITSATFYAASHPALIRNLICRTFYHRRLKLVEVWYSALQNELNSMKFNTETGERKMQVEALEKLQSAKQRFDAAISQGRVHSQNEWNGIANESQGPFSLSSKASIRTAFENYKIECSQILAIIKNLNTIKERKMKILSSVQEVYSRHQIYVIEEPFLSDVFRYKFRQFLQCLDEFKAQVETYSTGTGPEGAKQRETSQKALEDMRSVYEIKFTELKGKIQDDLKSCVLNYSIGTPQYQKQIALLGEAYKSEMSKLIAEFKWRCSSVSNEIRGRQPMDSHPSATPLNPKTSPSKISTWAEIGTELKKLLDEYWRDDVIPLLQKFHHFLEQTLFLILQFSAGEKTSVYKVLHSLQTAKRRFGDALWHSRCDAKKHLRETRKHISPNTAEYSEATGEILKEWRESMTPHMKRFTEELDEMDGQIGKLYKERKLQRDQMPKDDEAHASGDVHVGKMFDSVTSPLIVDYDSCIEDVSELSFGADTPEGKAKAEALSKLKRARSKLEEAVSQLKKDLKSEISQEKNSPENLGELFEKYREKLSPVVNDFKSQIESIDIELEHLNEKEGHPGRREWSRSWASPWHFSADDGLSRMSSVPRILNMAVDEENSLSEPSLDDLYRQSYRSVVIDFSHIITQLLESSSKGDEHEIQLKKEALESLEHCLREYGENLKMSKKNTQNALSELFEKANGHPESYDKRLSDKSRQALSSLRQVLDSKLNAIRETLAKNKIQLSIPSADSNQELERRQSPQMNEALSRLLREYWTKCVMPQLQVYHCCLEDIVGLPRESTIGESKDIHEAIRSLESAKRLFGDALWDARLDAVHNMRAASEKPGVKPNDHAAQATRAFEIFRKNLESYLEKFKGKLEKTSRALTNIYEERNEGRPFLQSKWHEWSDMNDPQTQGILDACISTLILEYDSHLEELCELRINKNSTEKQKQVKLLRQLKKTRLAFENGIRESICKFKEHGQGGQQHAESSDNLKRELLKAKKTFQSELGTIDDELKSLSTNKLPPRHRGLSENIWPTWQLPSTKLDALTLDVDDEKLKTDERDKSIHTKSLETPSTYPKKNKLIIPEPLIHTSFQKKYWDFMDKIDSILHWTERLDCQQNSPLFKSKTEFMVKLHALQDKYQQEEVCLKEESANELKELCEKFPMGSLGYRQGLQKMFEKCHQRVSEMGAKFSSTLKNLTIIETKEFPSQPYNFPRKGDENYYNRSSTYLDKELALLLNSYWRKEVSPIFSKYLQYLEEIIFLQLQNLQKDTEQIYKLLRALQMAKSQFGDELWSQRRYALQNLRKSSKKDQEHSLNHTSASEGIKENWQRHFTPHVEKFKSHLHMADEQLGEMFSQNNFKRSYNNFDKKLKLDGSQFDEIIDKSLLIIIIDYDLLLETLADMSSDVSAPEGQRKAESFRSLQHTMKQFRRKLNTLVKNLSSDYKKHSEDSDNLQKLYGNYSLQVEDLTSSFQSDLDELKHSLHNDVGGKLLFNSQETSLMSWFPPAVTNPEKNTYQPSPVSIGTSERGRSQSVEQEHSSEEGRLAKKEGQSRGQDHDQQPVSKPGEDTHSKIAISLPSIPEPILDDIFRAYYRGDVENFDSVSNHLSQVRCRANTECCKSIQAATVKLENALFDYTIKLRDLKKSALADLLKALKACEVGSKQYWQEVSSLINIYKVKLDALQRKFKSKNDDVKKFLIDTMKNVSRDKLNDSVEMKSKKGINSEKDVFPELFRSIWQTSVLPQFRLLHSCLGNALRLMLQEKVKHKEHLYALLMELLQEKRCFIDNLWEVYRQFVNGPRAEQWRKSSTYSHVRGDFFNVLKQKISPLLTKFSDTIITSDKNISDLFSSHSPTGGIIPRDEIGNRFENDKLMKMFSDAILVIVVECDGRLENLVCIAFDTALSDDSIKSDAVKKFLLSIKHFFDASLKLEDELHHLLQHHEKQAGTVDKIIGNCQDNVAVILKKFKLEMNDVDTVIKYFKKKLCIPNNSNFLPGSLMPWASSGDFVDGQESPNSPVMRSIETKPGVSTGKNVNDQKVSKKQVPDSNAVTGSVQPKSSPSASKTNPESTENEIDLPEPFVDDAFRDDYRVVITSFGKIITLILKSLESQHGSTSKVSIKDAGKQLETALMEYKKNHYDLKKKAAVKLNEISRSSDPHSQQYLILVSALLREINKELKLLHDNFDSERNSVQEIIKSQTPVTIGSEIANKSKSTDGSQYPDFEARIEHIFGAYWKTQVLPRLLKFHRCLEDINNLIFRLSSSDRKEVYKMLQSLQLAKRKFGDSLWHARHEVTNQLQRALKDLPAGSGDITGTLNEIGSSWQEKLVPKLVKFSNELLRVKQLVDNLYQQHKLDRKELSDDMIFHFDDARFEKSFCDAIWIIIIEYDCRLDDLSKLFIGGAIVQGRSTSDAFINLLRGWSELSWSIFAIKKELIKKLQGGEHDSNSIETLLQQLRSQLEAPVSAFRSVLGGVDSMLQELALKLGLSCRQYTTSVALSPWRIQISLDEDSKTAAPHEAPAGTTSLIKQVANALL